MPIINPEDIKKVNIPLRQGFDIGTLVTNISSRRRKKILMLLKLKLIGLQKTLLGKQKIFINYQKNK